MLTNKMRSNTKIAKRLVLIVALMLSLSYASVPLYDWFCRVTGYGGSTSSSSVNSSVVSTETIKVRFDSNIEKDITHKIDFKPIDKEIIVNYGQDALVFYRAKNMTDEVFKFTTSFNVAPYSAGQHFVKMECFCFIEQSLEPNEEIEMPVTFYVDPAMLDDSEAKYVPAVTLSYTAYEVTE